MVQKKFVSGRSNSITRNLFRYSELRVLISELLFVTLILGLSACGGGEEPNDYSSYSYQGSNYAQEMRDYLDEQSRRNAEEEARRQANEQARRAEEEKRRQEEAQLELEQANAERTLTEKPVIYYQRTQLRRANRSALAEATSDTQGYYVQGRRKSKDLLSSAQAQVILVGNTHSVTNDLNPNAVEVNAAILKRFNENASVRLDDNKLFADHSTYPDNVLLMEGDSYNSVPKINAPDFAQTRFTENELLSQPANNIVKTRGWENTIALLFAHSMLKSATALLPDLTLNADQRAIKLLHAFTLEDFSVLQLRNYFLFQSIVRALRENPTSRIIVTAGSCHYACDESLFSLLNATNIRYTTFEAKSDLLDISKMPEPAQTMLDQLDSARYDRSKVSALLRQARQDFLETLLTKGTQKFTPKDPLATDEDTTELVKLIEKDAEQIRSLATHLRDFFRREAYTEESNLQKF